NISLGINSQQVLAGALGHRQSAEASYYFRDIQSQHEIGLLLQSFGCPSARWESITRASIYFEAASIRAASYWNTIFTTVLTDVALPLTRYGANRQVRSVCSKPGGTSVKGI